MEFLAAEVYMVPESSHGIKKWSGNIHRLES